MAVEEVIVNGTSLVSVISKVTASATHFSLLAQDAPGPGGSPGMMLLPLLAIGLLYYVMVHRPETVQRGDHKTALDALKQNDRVITAGGIHGVVVKAAPSESDVVIRIDESNNTKIHIQRSSISRVITDKDKATES